MLDRDGIAAVGEQVSAGDILINKQSPTSTKDVPSEQGPPTYKQMPVSWKAPQGESCYVDKVLLTQNDDAHIVIKVISLCASVRTRAPLPDGQDLECKHRQPILRSGLARHPAPLAC